MAKTVNYTEENEARLKEHYDGEADEETRETQIAELADELGKNVKSVRAKLVRMGLYVKKEYKTKTGGKTETKEKIVSDIAECLGVYSDQLSQLDKATKKSLTLIRGALQRIES